jgi:predicted DNA-binding transcriptional regulator AlpA
MNIPGPAQTAAQIFKNRNFLGFGDQGLYLNKRRNTNARKAMMKLITFDQLKPNKGIPYCRVHLMRKVGAGEFPKPVPLSGRRIAWLEAEVDAWIAAAVEKRAA